MREAVFELFERINKLEDDQSKVIELRKAANGRLQDLLRYAFDPNLQFDLPEGPAPFRRGDPFHTHGMFWQEIRRLYIFVKGTKVNEARRQQLYIEMLEALHPSDADLLQAIKDKQWPYENITEEVVRQAFPVLLEG